MALVDPVNLSFVAAETQFFSDSFRISENQTMVKVVEVLVQ
jgi:hypothetical protein